MRPRQSVGELPAAKNTQPIRSLDGLRADTFEPGQELDGFLALIHDRRQRDAAWVRRRATSRPGHRPSRP
ncbi:hypothetical protein ACFQZC_37680 [Streptacidiphilus monticola]